MDMVKELNSAKNAPVVPLCPYFGKCGGCTAQHLEYSQQLNNKRKWLAQATNFPEMEINVFSDKEYFYRNRMDFKVRKGKIGLRSKDHPSEIIDVEKCVIAVGKINVLLAEVRSFFLKERLSGEYSGCFKEIIIRATTFGDTSISFVLNSESSKLREAQELIKEFARITSAQNVLITYNFIEEDTTRKEDGDVSEDFSQNDSFVVKGLDRLQEKLLGMPFFFPAQGFFQNNTLVAEKMQDYVKKMLKNYPTKKATLLELYAGVGTFGIINSENFAKVIMVESFKPAAEMAKINLAENGIKNAEVLAKEAHQLRKLQLSSPLYVITDPPRSGMDERVIRQLNELKPEVLVYISCNHLQLGKDLLKLKSYEVKSMALFDLFPQTPHLETVAELVRKR